MKTSLERVVRASRTTVGTLNAVVGSWTCAHASGDPSSRTRIDRSWIGSCDLSWYCDNSSAVGAIVKGASGAEDICRVAVLSHLSWAALHIRTWVEWIDTKSNPADSLSREGASEEVEAELGCRVTTLPCHNFAEWLQADLPDALERVLS